MHGPEGMGAGEFNPVEAVQHGLAHAPARKKEKPYGHSDWVLFGLIYGAVAVVLTTLLLTLGGTSRMHVFTLVAFVVDVIWIVIGWPGAVAACVIIGAGSGKGMVRLVKILIVVGLLIAYNLVTWGFMQTFSLPIR